MYGITLMRFINYRLNSSDPLEVDPHRPINVTVRSHVNVSLGYLLDIQVDRGDAYYCCTVLLILIILQVLLFAEVSAC